MSEDLVPIESLWTAQEAASFLKSSRSWVYKAAEAGTLPGVVRIGAMLRFRPEIIRAWVQGQSVVERAVKLPGSRG